MMINKIFIWMIGIMLLFPLVNADLVARWSMDDLDITGGVIADNEGDTNNEGSLLGGVTTGVTGHVSGQAFSFDGSDDIIRINGSDESEIDPTNSDGYTIVLWANQDVEQGDRTMISKHEADNEQTYFLGIEGSAPNTRIRWSISTTLTSRIAVETPIDSWSAGAYHMITIIYNSSGATDNERAQIYINDTKQTLFFNGVVPSPMTNSVSDIIIGQFENIRFWNGDLDEVCIFNDTLTSFQVSELYNFGAGINCNNLGVIDTTDPIVTLVNPTPTNNSISSNIIQVFNLSIIEDNLDTITLNFNGTNETGFVNDVGNFHSLTVNTMAEGLFTYQIHVNDTSGNEFVSELLQFTVDDTSPVITYVTPSDDNLTFETDLTGNISINGFNINLDIANLTVFNKTNLLQIFINVTSGITESSFTFTNSFNEILSNQADAFYIFRACFIDDANIETCQEVEMELFQFIPPPPSAQESFETLGTSGILIRAGTGAVVVVVLIGVFVELVVQPIRKFRSRKK